MTRTLNLRCDSPDCAAECAIRICGEQYCQPHAELRALRGPVASRKSHQEAAAWRKNRMLAVREFDAPTPAPHEGS